MFDITNYIIYSNSRIILKYFLLSFISILLSESLLIISGNSYLYAADEIVFTKKYNESSIEGIVAAKITTQQNLCESTCQRLPACQGYDFEMSTNNCRLFSTVTSHRSRPGWMAAQRGIPIAPGGAALAQAKSKWFHNGSEVILVVTTLSDGDLKIEFVYEIPRATLLGSGITRGSTLFSGILSRGSLRGSARLSSRRCGIVEYGVSGTFDPADLKAFVLRGQAPKRDGACQIQSWTTEGSNANLLFEPAL